jgi:hypothetical protein
MNKSAAAVVVGAPVDQFVEAEKSDNIEVGRYQCRITANGTGSRLVITPKPLSEDDLKKVATGKMEGPKDETMTMKTNEHGDVTTVLYKIGSSQPVVHVRKGGKRGGVGNQVLQNLISGLSMEAALVGTKPRQQKKKRRCNTPRRHVIED